MKKTPLINSEISAVVAAMGHTDMLTICDAGLPIPPEVPRIDLALVRGIPGLLETVAAVLGELEVEGVIVAEEMVAESPHLESALRQLLPGVKWQAVPHGEFKQLTRNARAIIRTGECTPYANVILVAGVAF